MADLPTDFWAGWIVTLTCLSVLGLCWLVYSIYFSSSRNEHVETPVWDETLSEGNNPAPMWWFWMVLTALVISVVYLMLYPGMGSYSGTLKWSQHGRLDHSFSKYEAKFSPLRKNILKRSIAELQDNQAIMETAERIFSQNCSVCHGVDATGQANKFPNLKDEDWQWGGGEEAITQTIKHGRRAAMIGWRDALGEKKVLEVKDYVKTLSADNNAQDNETGKEVFQSNCAACHGLIGEGNPILGAPNLSDNVWLYGNSDEDLTNTISFGRSGEMPAFEKRLDDFQVRMLVAWLLPMQADKGLLKNTVAKDKPSQVNVNTVENNDADTVEINEIEVDEKIVADESSPNGDAVYGKHCVACHQINGAGLPGAFPSLVGNATVLNDDPKEHINVVLNGLKDKVIDGVSYAVPMPGFSSLLSDEEIVAVINHERSQWGHDAKLITIDSVKELRK